MDDIKKVINGLEGLYSSMHKNQCYACSYEFIETAKEFGTEIIAEALELLQEQTKIVRCKDCKYLVDNKGFMNDGYCEKMMDEYCAKIKPEDDWFCANGEIKE